MDLDNTLYRMDMADFFNVKKEKDLQINEKKNIYQDVKDRMIIYSYEINLEDLKDILKLHGLVSINNDCMGIIEVNEIVEV